MSDSERLRELVYAQSKAIAALFEWNMRLAEVVLKLAKDYASRKRAN